MNPAELRAQRKQRIAARNAASRTNDEATSAFNYNPLFQKPTSLGPNAPRGGYHYFGPPPDAGTSYGCYVDKKGNGFIAPLPVKAVAPEVIAPEATQTACETCGQDPCTCTADVDPNGDGVPVPAEPPAEPPAVQAAEEDDDELIDLPASPATGEEMDLIAALEDEDKDELIQKASAFASLTLQDGSKIVTSMDLSKFKNTKILGYKIKADGEPAEPPAPAADPKEDDTDPDAEAVNYEVLTSVAGFKDIAEADVHMTLFDDESRNPYWNIDFRGQPTARVYLQDQPKPEEARATFVSAQYALGVSGAITKIGAEHVLKQIKAHYFANKVDETAIAKRITASAEANATKQLNEAKASMVNSFLEDVQLVVAGMDKNFYKDVGNPLKEALWTSIKNAGVYNPIPVIEAGWRRGATDFFQTVFAKALEYGAMDPAAKRQLKKALADMDTLSPSGEVTEEEEIGTQDAPAGGGEDAPSLHARLASASVALSQVPGLTNDQANDFKRSLKDELKLGDRKSVV